MGLATHLASRGLLMPMLLALPPHAIAEAGTPTNMETRNTSHFLAPAALDSPAQVAVRKLARGEAKPRAPRVPVAGAVHDDLTTRLEEIRVYGRNEPEDFVGRKMSPLMQFRARLEKAVPLSPAKKVQRALCFIGLCSNYGPEGIPLGDSPERRAEARLMQSTVQSLSTPY